MARNARYKRRARGGVTAAELRLTLLAGLFIGLAYSQVDFEWPGLGGAPPAAPIAAPDYYAESRKSRAILEAQEGASASVLHAPAEAARPATVSDPRLVRVIDGDTFWYGGDKIRIADIDTPETHPPRCAHEAELGARATRRLQALLAAGPFQLEPADRDTDRYGRKLRIVVRDGRSLGDVLVAEGLARQWGGRRMPWCGV